VTIRESRSGSGKYKWLRVIYGHNCDVRDVFGKELGNEILKLHEECNQVMRELGVRVGLDDFVKILILSFHLEARKWSQKKGECLRR